MLQQSRGSGLWIILFITNVCIEEFFNVYTYFPFLSFPLSFFLPFLPPFLLSFLSLFCLINTKWPNHIYCPLEGHPNLPCCGIVVSLITSRGLFALIHFILLCSHQYHFLRIFYSPQRINASGADSNLRKLFSNVLLCPISSNDFCGGIGKPFT